MKIIIKKSVSIFLVCATACILVGCNVGTTPAGGSDADVKAAFDKMPIEERAKTIMGSPAPMEFKANKIKEMYKKEGKEVPPEYLNKGGGSGPGK